MKNDDHLYLIGDAIREPDILDDPRWERLAAGELTSREIAELQKEAEGQLDVENALETFTPIGKEAQDQLKELFKATGEKKPSAEKAEPQEPPRAHVVPLRPKKSRNWIPLTISLAAAAVALLVLIPRGVDVPPLPSYELDFQGGLKQVRSGNEASAGMRPKLDRSSRLTLRLRPQTKVEAGLSLRAHLKGSGRVTPLSLPFHVTESGTVVIKGTVSNLLGEPPPGKYDLVLFLARKESEDEIPTTTENPDELKITNTAWQHFIQPIEIMPQ